MDTVVIKLPSCLTCKIPMINYNIVYRCDICKHTYRIDQPEVECHISVPMSFWDRRP